jgi:Apea-like HEPN
VARSGASDLLPGGSDRNAADAVLDFTIALEALLLPYDENARHGDLSYRFRMHGAHYLVDDPTQRAALVRKLSGIYEMRSRLVHGGKYPSLDEIKAARGDARELARRGAACCGRSGRDSLQPRHSTR